jgi:uncharacterized protein
VFRPRSLSSRAIASTLLSLALFANSTPQSVPYSLTTASDSWVTANDNWSGAPGIEGFRGDELTSSTGADPQAILGADDPGVLDVNANQTNPNTFATGGVTEFNTDVGASPAVSRTIYALTGSGTADAPYLRFHFNTTGASSLNFSYTAVDLDGSIDNSVQQIGVHYRIGSTGTWTNLPGGYIADASQGPSLSGARTTRTFALPAALNNQSLVQIRIMTTNAVGNDEWIGIENISLTGSSGPLPPSGAGSANPGSVTLGGNTFLSVNVTPGANPIASVTADLTSIGGSATQAFADQGSNLWTYNAMVSGLTGNKSLPVTITDTAALTGSTNIALTVTSPPISISAIQGSGATSPLAGQLVTTTGIVTFTRLGRVYIQNPDANADADPNTSEGLLLQFTSGIPSAANATGNLISVTGTVDEYRPDNNNLTITRILNPTISLLSTANALPTPVVLSGAAFTANGGLFQAERFEAMRASVLSLTVTGATNSEFVVQGAANGTSDQSLNGIFYGTFAGVPRPFREPGIQASTSPIPTCDQAPCNIAVYDGNPENLRVDSFRLDSANAGLAVTAGATVSNLTGVLTYENRYYTLLADTTQTPTISGNATATAAPAPTSGEIIVASWNMENYTGQATKLAKASKAIREFLRFPDVLATIEMNQPTALANLATQVNNDAVAAGQPNPGYTSYIVTPPAAGSQNIGFLVKAGVNVVSTTQVLASRTFVDPTDGSVDPTFDRPPLVLEATATRGTKSIAFTVIGNHLLSLLDIDADPDPAARRRRAKRKDQAEAMAAYVQQRLTANPNEHIVLVGDFNAFEFNDGYVDIINGIRGVPAAPGQAVVTVNDNLSAATLENLLGLLPTAQRYSYSFQGSAQTLDHMLYTPGLQSRIARASYPRLAADFPDQFGDDTTRVERMSDHDPTLVYLLAAEPLTSGIAFTRFGSVYNPITKRSTTNLQITNTSASTLEAPWQIVVPDPSSTVTLVNSTGTNIQGKYITVNQNLAAGASTTVQLQFANPGRTVFTYTPKFYSGPF